MASYMDPYNGVTRHAAAANVARPDLEPRKPNYHISDPAGPSQSWSSTGQITNSAGQKNRKSPRGARGSSSLSGIDSPLNLDNAADIVEASGLGRTSDGRSIGERMSDADPVQATVDTQPDGSTVHRRANPSGSVTATPIGSTASSTYGSELTYLDGMN